MKRLVYVKYLHNVNGITYSKQKVGTVMDEDHHGNLTVKIYNDEISEYETKVLRTDQFSDSPYLMDFE